MPRPSTQEYNTTPHNEEPISKEEAENIAKQIALDQSCSKKDS